MPCWLRPELSCAKLCVLQARMQAGVAMAFIKDSAGVGLSGALLAGAALQLLPPAHTTTDFGLRRAEMINFQAPGLVRLTCRVAASLHCE